MDKGLNCLEGKWQIFWQPFIINQVFGDLTKCTSGWFPAKFVTAHGSLSISLIAIIGNLVWWTGYRVSSTHAKALGVKTDAPPEIVWDVMRAWVKRFSVDKKGPAPGSSGALILSKEPKIEVDFTIIRKAASVSRSSKMVRFPQNPEANWGPKRRHTRQVIAHNRHLPCTYMLRRWMKSAFWWSNSKQTLTVLIDGRKLRNLLSLILLSCRLRKNCQWRRRGSWLALRIFKELLLQQLQGNLKA